MKKVAMLLVMLIMIHVFAQANPDAGSKDKKRAISYQSQIKDAQGAVINDGKYDIVFKFYDSENAEEPVWFENQNVEIKDGILNALIGSKKKLNPELFSNQLWLTLEINDEESEKQFVAASSYSMVAGRLDKDALIAGEQVTIVPQPDGRLRIDVISPVITPVTYVNTVVLNLAMTGAEYTTIRNKSGADVGALLWNSTSADYQGGSTCDDFVVNATNGRDLVLNSEPIPGTTTTGSVYVGTVKTPNDLNITGNLNVTGAVNSSVVNSKSVKFGIADPNYEYILLNNIEGKSVGAFMYNKGSSWYQGGAGTLPENYNDFVIYSKEGRDLVLKSDSGPTGSGIPAGEVYIGSKGLPNNLRVTGKLFATEIEVKLNVFPDYVFKKNYNLLSLSEVENHINSYGTLPGMPTEKEVVENGLNINQMQIKLVEKIEELTLHMIQLEKENRELKNRIDKITQ